MKLIIAPEPGEKFKRTTYKHVRTAAIVGRAITGEPIMHTHWSEASPGACFELIGLLAEHSDRLRYYALAGISSGPPAPASPGSPPDPAQSPPAAGGKRRRGRPRKGAAGGESIPE